MPTAKEEQKQNLIDLMKTDEEFGMYEMQSNIKPCPFCGTQPEWYGEAISDGHYTLRCPNCHCMIREDRRDKTIGMWNNRFKESNKESIETPIINQLEETITEWLKSGDENATNLAYQIFFKHIEREKTPASKEKPDFEEYNDEGCTCMGCDKKYDFDLIVPDETWKRISPKPVDGFKSGGLLCPQCIVERIKKHGWSAAHISEISEEQIAALQEEIRQLKNKQ